MTAMGIRHIFTVSAMLLLAACGQGETTSDAQQTEATPAADAPLEVKGLATPAAFAAIDDDAARAQAIFLEMSKVMLHPRCANCHPRSGGPLQGDDSAPHMPPVVRGGGVGAAAMACDACHGAANVSFASMEGSIPGAEPWLLAPASMGWHGAAPPALCDQIKDTSKNGGRSLDDLVAHNGRDHLVNWAWNPGEGRTPAPGDQATFGALTEAWVAAGAGCPEA
ncbi:MAG: Isoquinoline 1-oxidoreductase subunit [Pseudomonadota bacterium]